MERKVIKIATKKANVLLGKYDGFNNIILDDWRGFRFIFDAENFLTSKTNGKRFRLSQILKNEKVGYFNGGLLLANYADKKIFGNQKYLNCKTIEQYKNCYINFINQIRNKNELEEELLLVKNLCIIYSKNNDIGNLERQFKADIFNSDVTKNKIKLLT